MNDLTKNDETLAVNQAHSREGVGEKLTTLVRPNHCCLADLKLKISILNRSKNRKNVYEYENQF